MGAGDDDDLNSKLLAAAEKRGGRQGGAQVALWQRLLCAGGHAAQGNRRGDGGGWGRHGDAHRRLRLGRWDHLEHIGPGDILQFNKHLIHIETNTYDENDKLIKTAEVWLTRPHHTAIVESVGTDGSVTIIEQNVHPNPDLVNRNTIPALRIGRHPRKKSPWGIRRKGSRSP